MIALHIPTGDMIYGMLDNCKCKCLIVRKQLIFSCYLINLLAVPIPLHRSRPSKISGLISIACLVLDDGSFNKNTPSALLPVTSISEKDCKSALNCHGNIW